MHHRERRALHNSITQPPPPPPRQTVIYTVTPIFFPQNILVHKIVAIVRVRVF